MVRVGSITLQSRSLHGRTRTLALTSRHGILLPRITWKFTMTASGLIIFLLIGAIAGWLAGLIVRGFGFGLLGNIVVGIIGAFLAGWLLPTLGIGFSLGSPIVTSIIYAMIGAIVLLVLIGLIKRA
ncbi:GlsB/YeaQ/YmgE family stress response membrane protein [Rhodanobacter denitrificans]|nr:GlsB/YeaQ/YmgE family stress response membrane protein [Rhodanobacter denitrificans]UJJ60089.1 GlsB/YeaQ/YmgE family stress response membrane protein [Rhodanobacter denitrificans]UJM86394.1 GlsB/YeaQ/YmgE family stress response membrane protein [Rhodanobacter denitrificans]